MSAPDRIEAVRLERPRRRALDAADRRVIAQVVTGLALLVAAAAGAGAAVRAFLWASGLGA